MALSDGEVVFGEDSLDEVEDVEELDESDDEDEPADEELESELAAGFDADELLRLSVL